MSIASSTTARTPVLRIAAGILAAVVVAVVANTLIALVAHALGAADEFPPLQFGPFAFLTGLGTLAAAAGWAVIRRVAKRPATLLRRLVPAVLVVSLIPDLLLLTGDSMPGTSGLAVAALMVMHVAVAAAAVAALRIVLPVSDHALHRGS